MTLSFASRVPPSSNVSTPKMTVTEVTCDSSYPTGGEAITAANLGLTRVDYAITTVKSVGGTVNVANAHYDPVTAKLVVYDETPAEVADTATLATLVVQIVAFGR